MVEKRRGDRLSNRASRVTGYWTLPGLWRPVSEDQGDATYGEDAHEPDQHLSIRVPSIQPLSFDRLGAISPTSGLTSGTYAYRNSSITTPRDSYQRTASYHRAYTARQLGFDDADLAELSELEKQDAPHDIDEEDPEEVYQDEEDGVQGLVRRGSSQKRYSRSLHRNTSSARSLVRHWSSDRTSDRRPARNYSRRQTIMRDSSVVSALPPLPEHLRPDSVTPGRYTGMVDTEKRASPVLFAPLPGLPDPPAPAGPPMQAQDPDLVLWDGPDDPGNPMNWSRGKKWQSTFALGFVTFCVTFASSVFSPGTLQAAEEFNVEPEVMVLSTALFVLGFAFGPIIWGPMSELYGRKIPLFIGFVVFGVFQIPVAAASNMYTIFVCRFLAGFFGCAPLTVVGGALADFWAPIDRGVAVSIFSGATFLGPIGGPIVGGFLTEAPGYGWRWTAWVTLLFVVVFGTIGWVMYDESFGPVLLQRRAKKLRYATKNWAIHAPADEIEISMNAIVNKYMTKPLLMLIWEPILLLVTIYMSFIYGALYLFFVTYPISFIDQRGWSLGIGGLPFLAVMVGVIMGGFVNFFFIRTRYVRIMRQYGRVPPEERLVPMMVGSVALPVGLFWYALASDSSMSAWPQILAGAPVGMGIVLIFLQGINYIIDVYMMFANSAIAGNTIIRSIFGAAFPTFASYMYRNLGIKYATMVLGFVALALIPVPILFFVYGAKIRKLSRYTPKLGPGGPSAGSLPMRSSPMAGGLPST